MDTIITQTSDTLNQTVGTTMTYDLSALEQTLDSTLTQTLDTLSHAINTLNQTLNTKHDYAWIIPVLTLIVLIGSAFFILRQLLIQKKILNAQLLKDRILLGWHTDEPVTDEHITNVEYLPSGYLPSAYKKKYKDLKEADLEKKKELNCTISKYLYLNKVYDYFLYTYILYGEKKGKGKIKFTDPWGKEWQKKWLTVLKRDEVFMDYREFQFEGQKEFDGYLKKQMEGSVTEEDFSEVRRENIDSLFKELIKEKIIDKKPDKEGRRLVIGDIDSLGEDFMGLDKNQLKHLKYILKQSKVSQK